MPTAIDYRAMAEGSGKLPDEAILPDPAAAIVLGISVWTLRRNDPVPAVQITERIRGRRLGDIRRLTSAASTAP